MKNRQFLKKAVLPVFLVLVMLFVPTVSVSAVTEIDFASVYDIDRPINGQLFDFTAFMGNDYYKLLDKTTSTVQNGITWYNCTDGTYVKTDQKAIAGHVYMVEVHVVPVAGYTFSPDTTGTVNGYEIGIVAGGGDEIALTYEFPACPYPSPVAFTSGSTFETGGTAAEIQKNSPKKIKTLIL